MATHAESSGHPSPWVSPVVVDALLGCLVAMAVGVAVVTSQLPAMTASWPAYVFAFGFGVVLLWRRRYPVLVLLLTSLAICAYYTLNYPPIGLALPIAAALISVAEAGRLRTGIVVGAVLVVLAVYFQLVAGRDTAQLLGYEVPPVAALMGAAVALGDSIRSRRQLRAVQSERERQARLELEHEADDQRAAERLALARDLHDTLGHHLAVVLLHASVAAESLPQRTADAERALQEVRRFGRDAMTQLRTTVTRLRCLDTDTDPAAAFDRLRELLERARRGGLEVSSSIQTDAVPEPVGTAAYLIAQEAVTNVIRHAAATTVRLEVSTTERRLLVSIEDNGRGLARTEADPPVGYGLRGMRERAEGLDGCLTVTGCGPGLGTRVLAELPLPAAASGSGAT